MVMKFVIYSEKYPAISRNLERAINETQINIDITKAVDAAIDECLKKFTPYRREKVKNEQ
jgi:ribosome maturation protein Sdo1